MAIVFGFILGCDEEINDIAKDNFPPETKIFLFPDSSISAQPSKLTVGWWGDDPDGLVIGYFYRWNEDDFKFTTKNEISFELQIGARDTLYKFEVAAVDNNGNGKYDNSVIRNGQDYNAEPFVDENNDGVYNEGEVYYDIGNVDPEPSSLLFPIKNSAPTIEWNTLTSVPATSFPVITFGWNVDDLDGLETIKNINIAINDTNNIILLNGDVRNITITPEDTESDSPLMNIIINGNLSKQKLPGMMLDNNNRIFVQAEDISGAKSNFITLPQEEDAEWYVKKPIGDVLLIDDNSKLDASAKFYDDILSTVLNGKFSTWDINEFEIPYESITFAETIKLFDALVWYSDNQPDIELASATLKNFIGAGGHVLLSTVLPHPVDVVQLQDFLPVDSLGSPIKFVGSKKEITADSSLTGYPLLKTTGSSIKVQTLYPSEFAATGIYSLPIGTSNDSDIIGLKSNDNKIFFFGMPLHECDGIEGNVKILFEKVLLEDFGLSL